MSSHNSASIVGNLGHNVAVRFTNGNKPVANFRVATNETFTDAKGEKQTKTDWHNVVVFGKQAVACGKYLKQGAKVMVTGRMQTREYEDRTGAKKSVTEVVASDVVFLDPRTYAEANKGAARDEADAERAESVN
jgi:single-strand DNA-binding protein